jgi:hypothetical protein
MQAGPNSHLAGHLSSNFKMSLARWRKSAHPGKGARQKNNAISTRTTMSDNMTAEAGSPKKMKKIARKATKIKQKKEAEGATKTHDEAVVKPAALVLKGQRIAEDWPHRPDQGDDIEELQKRLDANVEVYHHGIFDILSDAAMIHLAPILIALSGKKKDKRRTRCHSCRSCTQNTISC